MIDVFLKKNVTCFIEFFEGINKSVELSVCVDAYKSEYTVQYTLHNVHCTLYSVQCTLHNEQYTVLKKAVESIVYIIYSIDSNINVYYINAKSRITDFIILFNKSIFFISLTLYA